MSILKVNTIQKKDGTQFPLIGQVLTATGSTQSATSSSSFVNVPNLSVAITPTSTSSKVYIIVTDVAEVGSSGQAVFTIARGGTNLAPNNSGMSYVLGSSIQIPVAMSYLDSPSSTSALTYTAQYRAVSGAINSQTNGILASITVMEVLA